MKNSELCPHYDADSFSQVDSQASTEPRTGQARLSIRCERLIFDTFLFHGRSRRASRNSAARVRHGLIPPFEVCELCAAGANFRFFIGNETGKNDLLF